MLDFQWLRQLYFIHSVILVLNIRLSSSQFPFLLPQPQKSPHPLSPYHSSRALSFSVPPLLLSIHLASFSHHESKSESVFIQSQFPSVSPSSVCAGVCVCACAHQWWMTDKSSHIHAHQSRVYIWNVPLG